MVAKTRAPSAQSDAQRPAHETDGLTSFSLIAAAIVLDLLVVSLLAWPLARAQGVSLWPVDAPISAYCLAAPALAVLGAWMALGFSLRFVSSFRSHLLRSAIGAAAILAIAFALLLGVSGAEVSIAGFVAIASVVALSALHANHLGIVRSLVRAGAFSLPEDSPKP